MTVQLEYLYCLLQFFNIYYYAGIMLNAFSDLLCSKLCWHSRLVLTRDYSFIKIHHCKGFLNWCKIDRMLNDNSSKNPHINLTTKLCYFGCSRSPDVNVTKLLRKITRPQNILMSCGLVIFIKNFNPVNIRRP